MLDLIAIQEEARKTLVYYGNRVLYSGALGQKDYPSLVKDQERLNYLYGVMANSYNPASRTVVTNGYLYNWFALTHASPFCAANAHVPTKAEWSALFTYVGYGNIYLLKEAGTEHWGVGNNGTDSYGFCALPSGILSAVGVGPYTTDVFTSLGTDFMALYPDVFDTYTADGLDLTTGVDDNNSAKICAMPVRLIVDTPVEVDGQVGAYYGNDGTKYKCVLIGSQWWVAQNLIETKYRDGSTIPLIENTPGDSLSTGARYAYDNDEANVYGSISGTTYFIGDTQIDASFILKAIEMIRHFQCRATDLSAIGAEYTPSAPPSPSYSDLIRTGHKAVTIGANSVTFSSPLPSADYTVTAWVIGIGESQYDLGTITPSAGGFTVSDVIINGTLHYQAIINI